MKKKLLFLGLLFVSGANLFGAEAAEVNVPEIISMQAEGQEDQTRPCDICSEAQPLRHFYQLPCSEQHILCGSCIINLATIPKVCPYCRSPFKVSQELDNKCNNISWYIRNRILGPKRIRIVNVSDLRHQDNVNFLVDQLSAEVKREAQAVGLEGCYESLLARPIPAYMRNRVNLEENMDSLAVGKMRLGVGTLLGIGIITSLVRGRFAKIVIPCALFYSGFLIFAGYSVRYHRAARRTDCFIF